MITMLLFLNQMIKILESKHNKKDFDCGKDLLNTYLKNQAGQDIKRKLSGCFVLLDNATDTICGYYTLSNNSIPLSSLPNEIQKKLPKSYTSIPTTLLGRLAIDLKFQGKGIGKILLVDALKRSYEISKEIGSYAIVVDPIDEDAVKFYQKYDFIPLPDSGKMFITINTLKQLFDKK